MPQYALKEQETLAEASRSRERIKVYPMDGDRRRKEKSTSDGSLTVWNQVMRGCDKDDLEIQELFLLEARESCGAGNNSSK